MANLTEMLGMGIAIQLRNAFSGPANAIVNSSRNLTAAVTKDAAKINDGWKLLAAGGSMMFLGTNILGMLFKWGHESLDTAAKFQVLRAQIGALTKDAQTADTLFANAKTFTLRAPFQIDQVTTSLKTLLAFGISSKDAMKDLATAGNWASLMQMPGGIEKAANIIGRINTGNFGYAMRSAQAFGISYADIAKQNASLINPKTRTTARGASPAAFLDAFLKAINDKFGDGMETYMKTLPGMLTNLKDQWIIAMADMGSRILPIAQDVLGRVLGILSRSVDLIEPFARAVGDALGMLLKATLVILVPLGKVVVWIMELAKDRPGLFKLGAALIALAGVLLNVAGAALILMGAFKILRFWMGGTIFEEISTGFMSLLGPMGWIIAAAGLFYEVWTHNLLGVRTILMGYWNTLSMVFSGVWTLIKTLQNGIGYMPVAMADALKKAGLFNTVVMLFMLAYRLRSLAIGVWEGLKLWVAVGAEIMAVAIRIVTPFLELGKAVLAVGLGLLGLGNYMRTDQWERLGMVLGVAAGAYVLLRVAAISSAIATGAWTAMTVAARVAMAAWTAIVWVARGAAMAFRAAMWLLDIAMDANPVSLLIMAIAALITIVVLAIVYHKELAAWATSAWERIKAGAGGGLASVIAFATGYRSWMANVKAVGSDLKWFKDVWNSALNWLLEKLQTVLALLKNPGTTLKNIFAGNDILTGIKTPPKMEVSSGQAAALSMHQTAQNEMLAQQREATRAAQAQQRAMQEQHKQPVQVHSTIRLDGKKVGSAVTTHQHALATGGK